jgi:predicted alpha/beta superfamily hydrolase
MILGRLRADRDATLRAEANGRGFPIALAEGCLVVSTDPAFDTVAGDHDAWAGELLQPDAGFAWGLVPCTAGARYKLVGGTTFVADPWARAYAYDDFGEISVVVPAAQTAHRERFVAVGAADVAPRTVRVWVPASAPTHVVLAADGQNLFEPDAPFGGWRLDTSAPAAMMIVGIDNTAARFDEYTHVVDDIGGGPIGGQADAYATFVHDVIEPLVEARYGTIEKRAVLGSSLGGLVSLVLADRFPGHYRLAMSMSGTVGWGSIGLENETILQRLAAHGHQGTAIYLDSGGSGDDCADADGDGTNDDDPDASDNYCENVQLRDVLAATGYVFDTDLFHWHEPGATHDEAAWAARVARPLGIFAGM